MGEGTALGDQVIAATIINGLPKSYDSWIIGKSGEQKLNPDQLCTELRIIAQRMEQRNKTSDEESEQGFNAQRKPAKKQPWKEPEPE